MSRLSFAFLALVVGWPSASVPAQEPPDSAIVRCRAHRSADSTFSGACVQGERPVGQLSLRPPQSATPYLWLGTISGERFRSAASGGPAGTSEIGLDVRPTGAVRLGREWLRLEHADSDSATLEFAFRLDRPAPANEIDVEILRRARQFLENPAHWNPVDSTDMGAAPTRGFSCAPATRQSMFCALYLATIEVTGDYAHFRPAINAIRQSIPGAQRYRHPLVDFNNAAGRTLSDAQAVLDAALAAVQRERTLSACDRVCLRSYADRYLDALARHDPQRLPVIGSTRFTENGHTLRLGEGFWKTAGSAGNYRVYLLDPDSGSVGVHAVINEGSADVLLMLRLRVVRADITEIETFVVRPSVTSFFAPEVYATLPHHYDSASSPAERNTREELRLVTDAYFTALETEGTPRYQPAPFATDANRYENGVRTTNVRSAPPNSILRMSASEQFDRGVFKGRRVADRRYPAIDVENGTVLAIVTFRMADPASTVLFLSEVFKISGGKLREIRAVMLDQPHGASIGWP